MIVREFNSGMSGEKNPGHPFILEILIQTVSSLRPALAVSCGLFHHPATGGVVMKEGDYLASKFDDGMFHVVKILKIELHRQMGDIFHVMSFEPVPSMPGPEDIDNLEVLCLHSPVASTGFPGAEVFGHRPVAAEELAGYFVYRLYCLGEEIDSGLAGRIYRKAAGTFPGILLKVMDFERYARESGRSIEEFAETARPHYNEGCRLADSGELKAAVEEFTTAIDAFPLYFQSIDNRGITYRDLGDLDKALDDFALSFVVNPGGHIAFYSIGEIQLKKGNVKGAKRIFTEALKRWPEHAQRARQFLGIIEQQTGETRKPKVEKKKKKGWKFW